jgi:phenylalanyl-tRNA synthetase beta chain
VETQLLKISLDWISDFVDLSDVEAETIADRLTLSTAEVEGFEILHRSVDGVVIGEVVEVERAAQGGHPPADGERLQLATVDCASARYVTVCGAPNLRVGMKAPFAPPGVTLAGNQRIETAQVAGHKSEGVLCSPMELGMSRWHEGVLECPAHVETGTPLSAFIPVQDVIVEIDNKSLTHRPDLWGHYAFARELAAIFKRELRPLPMIDLSRYDRLPEYPLTIDDTEGCPCYGCIEFKVAATVPSPLIIQRRLHALGQRTYNLMVDLTNYVMIELAQPTHAFDGDRLRAIRVAKMGCHGPFVTLDGQERAMSPDDLLIWNETEPVALAGVMGGLNSEVEASTTKVLLESANFKGSRIRRTSVRLDLRTESAQRFEKSQPRVNVKLAVARILKLIREAEVDAEVTSRFTVAGDLDEAFRPIELPPGCLKTMAGTDVPEKEVVSILHRLGFQAEYTGDGRLKVGIPPHRSRQDISIPADIAEEVLRIYGYDKIEPRLPEAPLEPLFVNKPLRMEHRARRLLAKSHGFIEVHNYGWTDDAWLQKIGFQPQRALELKNPSTQHTAWLRTALMPNLLALVPQNRAHRDRFRLFEIGHVYSRADDDGALETCNLAAVSFCPTGQPPLEEQFRAVKGAVEDLGRVIGGQRFRFEPSAAGDAPWQTADHWVAVRRGDRHLGGLGVLTGNILKAAAPEGGQVVWLELSVDALEASIFPDVKYTAPPVYPGSWQDFSLVWDMARGFAALEDRLERFSHPLVMRRDFLYAYKGKGLPKGQASYSYRFWLGAWDRTLSSQEIDQFRAAILEFLQSEGIPLR